MNNPILVVYRKELRELFRDKRVRTGAFIMPVAIIFLLMIMFGFVMKTVKPGNLKIHVVKSSSQLVEKFRQQKLTVIEVPSVTAGQAMITKGEARIVLQVADQPDAHGTMIVDAYIDPKEQSAQIAFGQIAAIIQADNIVKVRALLVAHNLPAEAQEPTKLARHEVQVGTNANVGELLVTLLPYLIVIWGFYGGMSIAGDLVAGEKEKATLETLLIAPVRRTEIVLGKFFALATVCLLSSFMTVVGLALVAILKISGTKEIMGGGGVTPVAALTILILMIPMVCLFASMLIAVSSYAKNAREAATYMSSLSLLVVLPGMFSQFIGLTDFGRKMWINAVPILNTANNIRNALLGKTELVPLLITVTVSTVLAAIALTITIKLFHREQVLVRV